MAFVEWMFGGLMVPVAGRAPWVGVAYLAVVLAVFTVLVFGLSSKSATRREERGKIFSGILEMYLYRHDMALQWHALARMFLVSLRCAARLILPLAIVSAVVATCFPHAEDWLAFRPVRPGEVLYLSMAYRSGEDLRPVLALPDGIDPLMAQVNMPGTLETRWRLRVKPDASHGARSLDLHLQDGQAVSIPLRIGNDSLTRLPRLFRPGSPAATSLAGSVQASGMFPAPSIGLHYPERVYHAGCRDVSWRVALVLVAAGASLGLTMIVKVLE